MPDAYILVSVAMGDRDRRVQVGSQASLSEVISALVRSS